MGCAEEDRACERLTHTKTSPPSPLSERRGGVLDTVRWGEDEKFSLSSLLKDFPIQRCYEPFFKQFVIRLTQTKV